MPGLSGAALAPPSACLPLRASLEARFFPLLLSLPSLFFLLLPPLLFLLPPLLFLLLSLLLLLLLLYQSVSDGLLCRTKPKRFLCFASPAIPKLRTRRGRGGSGGRTCP